MTAVRAQLQGRVCNATLTYIKLSPNAAVREGNFGISFPPMVSNSIKVCGHFKKMHVISLHEFWIAGARDTDEAPADLVGGVGVPVTVRH